ncbi:MAG TPA: hypothetical protein VGU45_07125 [Microvirga sp.]|jgi:hypothetical protein|nr:hypothetical protein [Microvirga sp.]
MRPTTPALPNTPDLPALTQAPLIPEFVLRAHHAHWPADHRFKAAARLLQSLWRADRGLPAGAFLTPEGHRRRLGSRLTFVSARAGANFLTPAIAHTVWRELAYREIGALYDTDRLRLNLLSSQPLLFNLFAPLKADLALATRVVAELLPGFMDEVTDVLFEHAPARGHPAFTGDHTAFDLLIRGRTPTGQRAFIALELKYAEGMTEAARPLHPRYDELAPISGLFNDPADPALRANPLQQLFRQHCLAQCMVLRDVAEVGTYGFVAPRLNHLAQGAATAYATRLDEHNPARVPFVALTLERLIEAIAAAGEPSHAAALHRRYTDFHQVDGELELALAEQTRPEPHGRECDETPEGAEAAPPAA